MYIYIKWWYHFMLGETYTFLNKMKKSEKHYKMCCVHKIGWYDILYCFFILCYLNIK